MRQILLCCFILYNGISYAQIHTAVLKPDALVKMTLRKSPSEIPLNFRIDRLSILDSRNDTSDVGYTPEKDAQKYCFRSGFQAEMHNWFSSYLSIKDTGNITHPFTLWVDIKKLRVSDKASPKLLSNGDLGRANNGWDKGVIIKIEYYLEWDSMFTPLYRYDSILHFKGGLERYAEEFISIGLRASLVKLFTLKPGDRLFSRKKILFADIRRVNEQRWQIPVFSDSLHKKGIFKTFDDFKNNKISEQEFKLTEGEMGDVLYVKENKDDVPTNSVWGFCDGENYYINSGGKYSQLVRSGYTFYFSGSKGISRGTKHVASQSSGFNFATNTGPKTTVFEIEMRYYQLDMETGEVY